MSSVSIVGDRVKSFSKFLIVLIAVGCFAISGRAQDSRQPVTLDDAINGYQSVTHQSLRGITTDWSSNHVVFSKPAPGSDAEDAVLQDPRYWMQQIRRGLPDSDASFANDVQTDDSAAGGYSSDKKNKKKKKGGGGGTSSLSSDWSVFLGANGFVGKDMYPTKYAFYPTNTGCSDFVVYNTSSAGATGVSASGTTSFDNHFSTPAGTYKITNGANSITLTASTTLNTGLNFQVVESDSTGNREANATNLAAAINRNDTNSIGVTATSGGTTIVTVTAAIPGTAGNSITLTGTLSDVTTSTPLAGGTNGQANILAFDKLYNPGCNSGTPNTAWAYNLPTGTVVTSPTISADGTQVAFAIGTGPASLGILNPTPDVVTHTIIDGTTAASTTITTSVASSFSAADIGGLVTGTFIPQGTTITAVASGTSATISNTTSGSVSGTGAFTVVAPSVTAPVPLLASSSSANYRTCYTNSTVPCYFAIGFNGGATHNDTTSSPYYDFTPAADALYIGDSIGVLHKFSPVFLGAPAEISGGVTDWPVTISSTHALTSPVLDLGTSNVFVGTQGTTGAIAYVNKTTPSSVTASATLDTGLGIVDAPLVDSGAAQLYAFSAQHGVYQLGTSFTGGSTPTATSVGTGSSTVPLYAGTLDNAYFGNTGTATFIGTPVAGTSITVGGGTPYVWSTSPCSSFPCVVLSATFATDAANLAAAINNTCSSTSQCHVNAANTSATASASGNVTTITNTTSSAIAFSTTSSTSVVTLYPAGGTTAIGSGSNPTGSLWVCGNPGGNPKLYEVPITNNVLQTPSILGPTVSSATTNCSPVTEVYNTSLSPADDWLFLSAATENATIPGGTSCTNGTGCVISYNVESGNPLTATAGAPEAGGTSGISIDNVINTAGDSQIYFSTLASGTCLTSSLTGGCAVQAAQSGLGQ